MIRPQTPFNGRRYLANTNTQEIHDLLNEKMACRINEISKDHIQMLDSLHEVLDLVITFHKSWNTCAHCLTNLDTG